MAINTMKGWFSALLLLFCQGPFANAQSLQSQLNRADSLNRRREYAAAAQLYEAILRKSPDHEQAMRGLGMVAMLTDKLPEAEAWYRKALKANPACGGCYLNLGRIRAMQKDSAGFVAFLDSAVRVQPKNGVILANRGWAYSILDRMRDAEADMEQSLKMAPDSATVQGLYADHLYRRKYPSLAYEHLEKAIRLARPADRPDYFLTRARWYYAEDKYPEAAADLDSLLRYLPGEPDALRMRGIARFHLNDYHGATADLTSAMAQLRPDLEMVYMRSASRYKEEDMDGSCEDLQAALSLLAGATSDQQAAVHEGLSGYCDSSKANYYFQRGIAMFNLRNYKTSANWHRRGLQKFPDHSLMTAFLANSYFAAGQMDSAIKYYEKGLVPRREFELQMIRDGFGEEMARGHYIPTISEIHYHLAQIWMLKGDPEAAMRHVNAGLMLLKGTSSDKKITFYQLRGMLYVELNQPDSAIRDFSDCIAMDDRDDFNRLGRAVAWLNKAAGEKTTALVTLPGADLLKGLPFWSPEANAFVPRKGADFGTALADCDAILAVSPDFVFALMLKAAILSGMEKSNCRELKAAQGLGVRVPPVLLEGCSTKRQWKVTDFHIEYNRQ